MGDLPGWEWSSHRSFSRNPSDIATPRIPEEDAEDGKAGKKGKGKGKGKTSQEDEVELIFILEEFIDERDPGQGRQVGR